MRFEQPRCLDCGKLAAGTIEVLEGTAILDFDDNGNAEYAGETKVDWNSQSPTNVNGYVTLECGGCHHRWETQMLDEEEPGVRTCPGCGKKEDDWPCPFPYPETTHCSAECWLADRLQKNAKEAALLAYREPVITIADVFTCPSCGGHRIEEVMSGVTVSGEVVSCGVDGDMTYAPFTNDDGEVACYRCITCGQELPGRVTDAQDLRDYLEVIKDQKHAKSN